MKQVIQLTALSLLLTHVAGCATTAANQRYDSPIPVYVDLNQPTPATHSH